MDSKDALSDSSISNVVPEQLQDGPRGTQPFPTADTPTPGPNPIPAPVPAPPPALGPLQSPAVFEPAPQDLIAEIGSFERDCCVRYKFNNRWDIVLSVLGLMLSIAIVGAGFLNMPWVSAVLGALVGSVVTAQKAFPFGSRAAFYRILIGQARNLLTTASQKIIDKRAVISTLSSLRMDFAQQLPRGSSAQSSDTLSSTGPRSTEATGREPMPGARTEDATPP